MEIGGFSVVMGARDGTYIRLVSPREYETEYVNRIITRTIIASTHK